LGAHHSAEGKLSSSWAAEKQGKNNGYWEGSTSPRGDSRGGDLGLAVGLVGKNDRSGPLGKWPVLLSWRKLLNGIKRETINIYGQRGLEREKEMRIAGCRVARLSVR